MLDEPPSEPELCHSTGNVLARVLQRGGSAAASTLRTTYDQRAHRSSQHHGSMGANFVDQLQYTGRRCDADLQVFRLLAQLLEHFHGKAYSRHGARCAIDGFSA